MTLRSRTAWDICQDPFPPLPSPQTFISCCCTIGYHRMDALDNRKATRKMLSDFSLMENLKEMNQFSFSPLCKSQRMAVYMKSEN